MCSYRKCPITEVISSLRYRVWRPILWTWSVETMEAVVKAVVDRTGLFGGCNQTDRCVGRWEKNRDVGLTASPRLSPAITARTLVKLAGRLAGSNCSGAGGRWVAKIAEPPRPNVRRSQSHHRPEPVHMATPAKANRRFGHGRGTRNSDASVARRPAAAASSPGWSNR